MSQLSRVAKHLKSNRRGPGITAGRLAFLAGIPKTAVYRRIYDLRTVIKKDVQSNWREVNGKRRMFYRLAS